MVNSISSDPEQARVIRENFIGYSSCLLKGRFKSEDYVHAVAYVSYKLMGYNNQESYARTFPARYRGLVAKGTSSKDISSYVHAYNKNKLVNLILEQSVIPSWVLNQDVYQKAINTQLELMVTAKSEKVRSDAANSILTHLKKPEKAEIELNIGVQETSGMKELKDALTSMAEKQRELITSGATTREVAHQPLIEGTAKDITPDK